MVVDFIRKREGWLVKSHIVLQSRKPFLGDIGNSDVIATNFSRAVVNEKQWETFWLEFFELLFAEVSDYCVIKMS